MLQHHLTQTLGASTLPGQTCRIQIELDEYSQDFTDPTHSHATLQARATLYPRYTSQPITTRTFRLTADAPTPDAPGGVLAHRQLANDLSQHLRAWLTETPTALQACQPPATPQQG